MLLFALLAALLATQVPTLATPADTPEIERLTQRLGSTNFAEREAATKRLDAIGEPALDSLRKVAACSKDAEIRCRADLRIHGSRKQPISSAFLRRSVKLLLRTCLVGL
jgi:hypothetical protein